MRGIKPSYQRGFYAPGKARRPLFPQLWEGCIRAWSMGLGPTGATVRDWSGRRHHGTIGTLSMDPNTDWIIHEGYALDFDGTDDRVELATDLKWGDIQYGGTVTVWARTDTTAAGLRLAFANRDNNRIYLGHDGTAAYIRVADGSNIASTFTVSTGVWYHLAVTWTPSGSNTAIAFVNGNQVGTSSGLTWSAVATEGTAIGSYISRPSTYSNFWDGYIDDVRVYNRTLAPKDIKLLASRRNIAYEFYPGYVTAEAVVAAAGTPYYYNWRRRNA